MARQALLFSTHTLNPDVFERFENIQLPESYDRFLLVDGEKVQPTSQQNMIPFTTAELKSAGYQLIAPGIVPGSNHFPVLDFCLAHPEYDFVWNMEYDVVFTGSWRLFFEHVGTSGAGFLTTQLFTPKENPDWFWWRSLRFAGKRTSVEPDRLLASFNPLYRLSQQAATILAREYKRGWTGHHEVSMATLLQDSGIPIEDLGCPPKGCGVAGRWYSLETYNHRGIDFEELAGRFPNTLFHPVKWNCM